MTQRDVAYETSPHPAVIHSSVIHRTVTNSPLFFARFAGVLYLVNIACGLFGEAIARGHLVVAGNAAATAHNIAASELLFRAGILGDLLMHITDIPMTIIFYFLLKPINRDLSLLSAMFSFLQTAILCANKLTLVLVLVLLGNGLGTGYGGGADLRGFSTAQLESLASLALTMHENGFAVGLIFFAVSAISGGYLMYRSGYFPRTLGILQIVAGVCYLINSSALLLNPAFAARLFPAILVPAFIGEFGTCLYLLIRGLNLPKWNELAKIQQESPLAFSGN
jgi:hypothetical protein